MTTKFISIRVSESTMKHLRDIKAPREDYDGLLRTLIWVYHNYEGLIPQHPVLPGEKMEMERIELTNAKQIKLDSPRS